MSQFGASNYEIPRTSGVCASTGRTLEPGETCYVALVDLPPDQAAPAAASDSDAPAPASVPAPTASQALGLMRMDISQEAWRDGYRPPHLFSYWKTTVPEPNAKKKLFVDDAVLMNLLRRLAETDQPQRLAFRYVLALILMRKKLLRYDGVRTDEQDRSWWLLTPKLDVSKGPLGKWSPDETIDVLDPRLDESQIEQVTQQLGEILEAEL